MAVWAPSPAIAVKVIGLVWRGDELLLAEIEDSQRRVKGLRPLGGSVEFGETREHALAREFTEELGCDIAIAGPWHAFENIYQHEGATGHEYLFAAAITLGDPTLYRRERLCFAEHDGLECTAVWQCPTRLPPDVAFYPERLLDLIRAGSIAP